jgi:metal-responsive CopG/Arc/MetJ family transcriptional regulator
MKDEMVVSVKLPKKLVNAIDRIALEQRRTRTNLILVVLEEWIRQQVARGQS